MLFLISTVCACATAADDWKANGAVTFQAINHIRQASDLPLAISLAHAGIDLPAQGWRVIDGQGKPLVAQRCQDTLYVRMSVPALATAKFILQQGKAPTVKPGFTTRTQGQTTEVDNGKARWTLSTDGVLTVRRNADGKQVALELGVPGETGKVDLLDNGPLVMHIAYTAGAQRWVIRGFAQSTHWEITQSGGDTLQARVKLPVNDGARSRLFLSLKEGAWSPYAYMDDVERDYQHFDFFFPFDWAMLEGQGIGVAILPSASAFRLNLQRKADDTWEATAATFAQLKAKNFERWHERHQHSPTTYQRYTDRTLPAERTVGFALVDPRRTPAESRYFQSLRPLVVAGSAAPFILQDDLNADGVADRVTVEDRNGNGLADLTHDRWTWHMGGETQPSMIYAFEQETTNIFSPIPPGRVITDEKGLTVPHMVMKDVTNSGAFCQGSKFYGGQFDSGYVGVDNTYSGNVQEEHRDNFEIFSYDLDNDGDSDIVYMPRPTNMRKGTAATPHFFGGEAGPMVDIADREKQVGVTIDPCAGFAYPIFPVRYITAGDSLTHFWSLTRRMKGWMVEVENTLIGGHDWPQGVMDLDRDGYTECRFYTEAFAMPKDPQQPVTMDNMRLMANPMRWTINLDNDHNGLQGDPGAHLQMSERARDWDMCVFARRSVPLAEMKASMEQHGPAGVARGYFEYKGIRKTIYTDPWGNSVGFTGVNQPPVGWKGERIDFFTKDGQRTGWGDGWNWIQQQPYEIVGVVYTDYDSGNTHAPEATHPGVNNMNRIDIDTYGRCVNYGWRMYFSPITGRMHLRGADMGYELTSSDSFTDPFPGEDKLTNWKGSMGYPYWVWVTDTDTYKPGGWWRHFAPHTESQPRRIAYFDRDLDGYYDAYMWSDVQWYSKKLTSTAFTTAIYVTPLKEVAVDKPTPFLVQTANQDLLSLHLQELDYRSRTLNHNNRAEYDQLTTLVNETQVPVIASRDTRRAIAQVTLTADKEGLPKAQGYDPLLILRDARPKVALDACHAGKRGQWENLDGKGYSALRTAFAMENAETVEIAESWSEQTLNGIDLLIVVGPDEKAYEPAELQALATYLQRGGRVLVVLPHEQPLRERMAPVLATLGCKLGAELGTTVAPYLCYGDPTYFIRPDVQFDPRPDAPSDIRDCSGLNLFANPIVPEQRIDQLSFRAACGITGGQPLLTYKEGVVLASVNIGKGLAIICGEEDLFNNMAIAKSMNTPRITAYVAPITEHVYGGSANSAFWNRFTGNRTVRNNLVKHLLAGKQVTVELKGNVWNFTLPRGATVYVPQALTGKFGIPPQGDGPYTTLTLQSGVYKLTMK
jgi:hypothetical protein